MSKQVEIGQRYQLAGAAATVWEVVKIVPQAGIPHARLISIDPNKDSRLMACSVLLEASRYRLVRDSVAAPEPRERLGS